MDAPEGTTGTRATGQRPPPKLCFGIGGTCLLLNHLSVALGDGLEPEALLMGCGLVLLGCCAWSGDLWAWTGRSRRREIIVGLLVGIAALCLAEGASWFAYGQHLFG